FLGLYYSSEKLVNRYATSTMAKPVVIALMISIGIGLHNLGEGLAIGAAIGLGAIALSKFLIVGFTIHNTTEGLAIAAPMTRVKPMIGKLAAMGMIAGTPAIFGAWIGGFIYSPFTAVVFLSVGAGAIFQVVAAIINWIRQDGEKTLSNAAVASGIAVGMLVMYLTSILV
ncbi:MAG: divalent cation transporter, partial [Nitrosopumilaceae archaeon]